jgi:hypothetical protein
MLEHDSTVHRGERMLNLAFFVIAMDTRVSPSI